MSNHQFSFPNLICHVSGFYFDCPQSPPPYLGPGESSLQPLQEITELSSDFLHLAQLLLESRVRRPQLLNDTGETHITLVISLSRIASCLLRTVCFPVRLMSI